MNFWLFVLGLFLLSTGDDLGREYKNDRRWWMRRLGTALWALGAVVLWNGLGGS